VDERACLHPWDVLGAESGRATPWQAIINVATSLAPGYSNWLINQNPLPAILHEARSDPTFSWILHPVRNRQLQIREPDPSSWSHSLQKHSRGRPQQMSRTHVVTQYFLLDFETVARLQVDPELRTHPEEKPNRAVASIAIRRLPRATSLIQHPRQDEPPFRVPPSRTCRAHHNGFKNPWHLAHGRIPGPGGPAGRRYPDDRIGGRGSTGLHGAQRPGCDHLGGTPLGEHTLRYPRLPANAPRPRTSSRARDTGKIPVVQHSTQKSLFQGQKQR